MKVIVLGCGQKVSTEVIERLAGQMDKSEKEIIDELNNTLGSSFDIAQFSEEVKALRPKEIPELFIRRRIPKGHKRPYKFHR